MDPEHVYAPDPGGPEAPSRAPNPGADADADRSHVVAPDPSEPGTRAGTSALRVTHAQIDGVRAELEDERAAHDLARTMLTACGSEILALRERQAETAAELAAARATIDELTAERDELQRRIEAPAEPALAAAEATPGPAAELAPEKPSRRRGG